MNDFESKRTIEEALDLETGEIIESTEFFTLNESTLIHYRRLQQEAINGIRKPKFICPYCYQILKISGKSTRRGVVSFFAHLYDSDDCEIKTNGEYSKEEIEARKYAGIKESKRHIDLKNEIFHALTTEESERIGIKNVAIEQRFESENPLLNWRKPDVYSEFQGKKLVFELQLSTTFLSVVVSRDIFYRLNETFIIWVFNFSLNKEYINLGNLMCKDIYYSNKRNAFIFDEEARRRTKSEGELILLCIWFEPVVRNGIPVKDEVSPKQQYIKLTDLKFDEVVFKPYFIDADSLFFNYFPEQFTDRINRENESRTWLENIEEEALSKFEKERQEKEDKERLLKENLKRISDGIKNGEFKLSPVKKKGKWGYEAEGEEIIPPVYNLAEEFLSNETAKVGKNRKFGFIDKLGKEIVPPLFHEVFDVHQGFCIGRINKEWFKFEISSGVKYKLQYEDIQLLQPELNLLKITRKETEKEWGGKNSGGWNIYYSNHYFYFGIMDFSGRFIIPPNYSDIEPFIDGQSTAKVDGVTGTLKFSNNSEQITSFIYDVKELDESGKALAKKDGLLGFLDEKGNEVIPCIFDSIPEFEDENEKVIASSNKRLGIIDSKFNILIPFLFDKIQSFEYGKAKAQKEGLWGYIDETGNELIPCIYDTINSFEEGKAIAQKNGHWGYIDMSGKELIPCIYQTLYQFNKGRAEVQKEGFWGYIDESGKELIPCIYNTINSFEYGKAKAKKEGFWGYIDESGNELIPCIYDAIHHFEEGKAEAQKEGLRGYIDESGKELIPCIYDKINSFKEGKAKIQKNGLWGYIDESGNELIPCIYDKINSFKEGKAKASKNGLWGYIEMSGNQLLPCQYSKIYLFSSGRAKVQKSELWGYLDKEFKEITPCKWNWIGTEISTFDYSSRYGSFDREDKNELYAQIDDSSFFEEDFIKVKNGNLWGGINSKGEQTLTCAYAEISKFINGKAKVKKGGFEGYIIKMENELTPCIYDAIHPFEEGKAKAQKNRLWGFIDESGKEIIKLKYEIIEEFKNNMAKVKINGKWGFIDLNGHEVVKAIYDELHDFYDGYTTIKRSEEVLRIQGLARYKFNDKRGYVDSNGKEYWQYWKY